MTTWHKTVTGIYCLLFILVPLVFLPSTSELFEFNKIILTYLFAILIGFAWIGRMISEKRWIFKHTILDIPLIAFLVIQLISLLFSIDLHASWYGYYSRWNGGLLSLISYSFLYWAFVANVEKKEAQLVLKFLVWGSIPISIWATMEHFGFSPSCLITRGTFGVDCWVQDVQTRVFATLGQPNWLAAYLLALIWLPIAFAGKIKAKISSLQLMYWLAFILILAVLLFTRSRSGILAFAVSSGVYWGIQAFKEKGKLLKDITAFAACGLILATLIPNPVSDLIFKKAAPVSAGPALETGGTESGSIRKIVWTGAIRIWQGSTKNFLIGTGPETFAESYYQYRPIEHNQTSEWELLYNKAHNEFLNFLSTTGLLGLASYLILLVVMIKVLGKDLTDTTKLALLAGWISIPITNFWGFSVVIVQLEMFLLPAIAIALSKSEEKSQPSSSSGQTYAILITAAVALWLMWLTGRYWMADIDYAKGQNAIKGFQVTSEGTYLLSAYQNYTKAFSLNSGEPAISSELSVAAAYLANSLRETDATSAAQLAQIAVAASDKAIATSPHHPNYYKSRARTMILLSDLDHRYLQLAAEAMIKAGDISPTDPRIPFNLGVIYNYMEATPSAIEEFQKSLDLKPDFGDPKAQLELLK